MRWIASLLALGLMMALFHRVTAQSPLEARAALALGVLLVAAWIAGTLARRVRVPGITGYLLVGVALGPAWLHVVRADEAHALGFLADACFALIAFGGGAALTLTTLRAEWKSLARVALGTALFPFAAVTFVLLSVSRWFPLSVHQPFGSALGVSLVLGAIAAASSPVVTIAVQDEVGGWGPFARAVLTVSMMKDVALVLVLVPLLVIARAAGSPGAVHLGESAGALGLVAASVALGAVVGIFVAEYHKHLPGDPALVCVAVGFVVAVAARILHSDPVLAGLAGGVTLGAARPQAADRLRREVNRAASPVYAVSFTVAGAGLRLDALGQLWPWVLLLAGLRTVALRYGTLWAGRSTNVTPALAREGWLGLISQSGVVLSLGAVARQAFPAWGVSLEGLVIALVAVHEIAGSIGFRRALARVGELKEEGHGGREASETADVGGAGGGVQRGPDWSHAGRVSFDGAAARAERGAVRRDRPSGLRRVRDLSRHQHGLRGVPPRPAAHDRQRGL